VSGRRLALLSVLAAVGLGLYLWPALAAPVVLNSDSAIDLQLAREGRGILSPAPAPRHPPKPAYLLFLRTLAHVGPEPSLPRRIVIVQSVLVWFAIALASWLLARFAGTLPATVLYILLIGLLRVRDVCSVVMPEALSIALSLPLAASLILPPPVRVSERFSARSRPFFFLYAPTSGRSCFCF
jgi:hypothetical protein